MNNIARNQCSSTFIFLVADDKTNCFHDKKTIRYYMTKQRYKKNGLLATNCLNIELIDWHIDELSIFFNLK